MVLYKESRVIDISPLTVADLDQVMEIDPVAFGSHHWTRQSFINELANPKGFYYAARLADSDRVLGYSGFWRVEDEAHITTLAVHPDFRRQKVGEKLLINDIIQARKLLADWLTLEVRVSNQAAQKLYERFGFKSLGIRPNYYLDNDEDAMILWTDRLNSPAFMTLFEERLRENGWLEQHNISIESLHELFGMAGG